MPEHALYVGRPTPYGNPFPVTRHDPALAVARFQAWIAIQPDLLALVHAELTGRDLACWCPLSAPCHADVLLQIVQEANVQQFTTAAGSSAGIDAVGRGSGRGR